MIDYSWQDLINGGFEFAAGAFSWANVRQLVKDKKVSGVYIPAWVVFTLWGLWNLYYYPHLGQWFSFFGGLSIVVANSVWLYLAWRYRRNDQQSRRGSALVVRRVFNRIRGGFFA